jgi:hypothetical protein
MKDPISYLLFTLAIVIGAALLGLMVLVGFLLLLTHIV